ncbi:acyltransferase [Pontibacter sp. SGAir0037]|uniref:acyltransferase family protein n=1 Tax=Pontibacter sp. SGAir0037 TaxID=2571030 RepID=UPI0010CD18C3|nr:acyltransferase [Pontibacter sp. SGAir0037]QCR23726.1 hypothetical protein C1N53_16155 [Pontibacter sp. SGAir0037]
MNRFLFLDSLRGFAALFVVLFHYTATYRDVFGHNFSPAFDINYGNYGVELFFMISGFVIFFSFRKITSSKEFLIKRAGRLYPAYWISVLATFLCVQLFGLPGFETSFSEMLVNLTMFQKLVGVPNVDWVYWTLFQEWMFYLMLLGIFMVKKLDKMLYIGIAWMALSFINVHVFEIKHFNAILNLYYGVFFYSGILFYLLKFEPEKKKTILACLALSLALALSIYAKKGLADMAIVAGIYAIFYLGISGKLDFLINKPFTFLGSISYSLYLFHQFIGYIILNYTKEYFGNSVFVIVPPILFSIACAYLITTYVEQPSMQLIKNWYGRKTAKPVVAGAEDKVPSSGFAKQETAL